MANYRTTQKWHWCSYCRTKFPVTTYLCPTCGRREPTAYLPSEEQIRKGCDEIKEQHLKTKRSQ